jgi:Zn finger protein HypA/HybF involved in hydrogenase expression
MGIHKIEDIVAINDQNGKVKCLDCMEKNDWDDLKEEEIISVRNIENDEIVYFCDSCKHKL